MNSIARKSPAGVDNKGENRFNTKNLTIAIVLSITFGLGWGFGFLTTSHDVLPIVIIFQAIFVIVVGSQGVLLFVLHGVRNSDARALWKRILFIVPRKMYSIAPSTGASATKSTKQASIPTSTSMDTGLSLSRSNLSAIKSPSLTFSENSTFTTDTAIDVELNPSYVEVKNSEVVFTLGTNVAYETAKQNLSAVEDNVYDTVR